MTSTVDDPGDLRSPAARGLWLLPTYGVSLALSTLTLQPDVREDFAGYARYVTTDWFLASHLGLSVGGAAVAVLGVVAAAVFLSRGPARRAALTGVVLTIVAQVYLAASFGGASFVQPGIGRAHLRGVPGVAELNADTAYGPALVATAIGAVLLLGVASVTLGTAIARTSPRLRWAGTGYAVALPLFSVAGVLGLPAGTQPALGLLLAASTVVLARRLPAEVAGVLPAAPRQPRPPSRAHAHSTSLGER
jgi:hypothetical protein